MTSRDTITYDPIDHLFVLTVDGREIGRAASYAEGELQIAQFYRAEQVIKSVNLPEGRIVLSVSEAAEALGMGRNTLMELINAGDLPAFRLGDRTVRIGVRALEAWIARQEQRYADAMQPDPDLLARRTYNRRTS